MISPAHKSACDEILARLWDLLDGELDDLEETAIRGHLEWCRQCYAHYDFALAYLDLARRIRRAQTASHRLRRRLLRAVREAEAKLERYPLHTGRNGTDREPSKAHPRF